MSIAGLKKLIESFEHIVELPVEVEDIRKRIVELGFQDQVIIDGRPGDAGKIRGVFYQYTQHGGVYAQPELCTIIGYNSSLPIEWQRLVCCKELVHIFDDDLEKTDCQAELDGLMGKLLGPLSTDDYGLADLMATKDKFALYEGLPLLFPKAARDVAVHLIKQGNATIEAISEVACIPVSICGIVLSPDWPKLSAMLLDGE